jgi:hypothetical protein
MVVGISGHQRLQEDDAWPWVRDTIRSALSRVPPPLIGLSSLAIGADQLFSELILAQGGELRVILPFPKYRETFTTDKDLETYRTLLGRATSVEVLPALPDREESYLAAGQRVVDLADWMIAVWNGRQAVGLGGTGDIVQYALAKRKDVLHVDPELRRVTRLLPRDGSSSNDSLSSPRRLP